MIRIGPNLKIVRCAVTIRISDSIIRPQGKIFHMIGKTIIIAVRIVGIDH